MPRTVRCLARPRIPFALSSGVMIDTDPRDQVQGGLYQPPTFHELVAAALKAGLEPETSANVRDGVARALEADGPAPHVLICGGLHFAGEVLAMSVETWPQ